LLIDIVVDNCAICRNHIMDLCKWTNIHEGIKRASADIEQVLIVRRNRELRARVS
jgi:hypothetical protein